MAYALVASQQRVVVLFKSALCRVNLAVHLAYSALCERSVSQLACVELLNVKSAAVLSESEHRQFLHFRVCAVVDTAFPYRPVCLVLLVAFHEVTVEFLCRLVGEYGVESHADGVEFLDKKRVLASLAHGSVVDVQLVLR